MRRLACDNEVNGAVLDKWQAFRECLVECKIRVFLLRCRALCLFDHAVRRIRPNDGNALRESRESASNDAMSTTKVDTERPGTLMICQDGVVQSSRIRRPKSSIRCV